MLFTILNKFFLFNQYTYTFLKKIMCSIIVFTCMTDSCLAIQAQHVFDRRPKAPPMDWEKQIEERVVTFIYEMIDSLRYSSYKLGGTHFDLARGIYILDCSTYVDYILKTIYPRAYSKLVTVSGTAKPTTYHYYQFFSQLTETPQRYWNLVENVLQLRPGDILVFRKKNRSGSNTTGHVMIVMDKPVRNKNILKLRIADSAPFRHSQDTRPRNVSGIGIGTLLIKLNPKTFKPFAYAWKTDSPWKHNVIFAMARPA